MTKLRIRPTVLPASIGAAVLLAVLYGIWVVSVHAVPASLKPLALTRPPRPAPAVAFMGAGGKVRTLDDFKGRVVLLNLWAPWCAPCVRELPALAALAKAMPGDRFAVVAVDVGREGQGEAQAFLNAHGAGALPAYVDSNASLLRSFAAYGLPMSVLIDAKGQEIARAAGPADWSAPDSIAWLKRKAER